MSEQSNQPTNALQWLSPLEAPFHLAGFAWMNTEHRYRRLPSQPTSPLPPSVDNLANHTAGGQIRFRTNSSRLAIKVKLAGSGNMYHMPATGQCGFDCYLGEPGNQQYLGTTRFDHTKSEFESQFYDWQQKREFAVTIHFPLYQGVQEVWIGVDSDADVHQAPAYTSNKRVVVYGTSITQGGCASRPGMAYTNILSRSIPLEFINLGFSGSGKGEPEVARTIAELSDVALFVLDYEGNAETAEKVAETLPKFIQILREKHPDTPILVVSCIQRASIFFDETARQQHELRKQIQQQIVERLQSEGEENIDFLDGSTLFNESYLHECTVDGTHPTDLGFMSMAQVFEPVFKKWLHGLL